MEGKGVPIRLAVSLTLSTAQRGFCSSSWLFSVPDWGRRSTVLRADNSRVAAELEVAEGAARHKAEEANQPPTPAEVCSFVWCPGRMCAFM